MTKHSSFQLMRSLNWNARFFNKLYQIRWNENNTLLSRDCKMQKVQCSHQKHDTTQFIYTIFFGKFIIHQNLLQLQKWSEKQLIESVIQSASMKRTLCLEWFKVAVIAPHVIFPPSFKETLDIPTDSKERCAPEMGVDGSFAESSSCSTRLD